MTGRYLIIVSERAGGGPIDAAVRFDIAARPDVTIVTDEPDLFVMTLGDIAARRLPGGRGFLLGTLYPTASSTPVDFAVEAVSGRWAKPDGRGLAHEFWGDYVAILRDAHGELAVMRAPFGRLPCFHIRRNGKLLIASDVALLALAGGQPRGIDWSMVAYRLAFRDIPSPATCLQDICELRGGSRLSVTGGHVDIVQVWSPWDHAGRRHWVSDPDLAASDVWQAVLTTARAAISGADRALLMLSGGLDSSILAASLAELGGPYNCFNLSSQSGVGDERRYARAVTDWLRAPLIEAIWDVGMVDISRSHGAALPNPMARSFMQGTNVALARATAQSGADLTIDGGGGDNVFCALQSVAPVTDAFLHGRSPSAGWATAASIATLAQVGTATVLMRALQRAFRSPTYRWQPETRYLAPALFRDGKLTAIHPWLDAPKGAETGTAAHIALIVAAQGWAEASDLRSPVRHASPLASQPVVEACLRVPSWWWFKDDRNRAVARAAYAALLPAEVIGRRSKGTPDSYIAELYEANRKAIRTMLLDGRLRSAGLLDLPALERALGDEGPVRGTAYHQIMRLADTEAWAAAWS